MRFLFLAILAFLLYRLVKGVFASGKKIKRGDNGAIFDDMIQDPLCEAYIPRRESVKKVVKGRELFLCKNCADKFESEGKG